MPTLLSWLGQLMLWTAYFATNVYGHLSFKLGSRAPTVSEMLFSFWGLSAMAAWGISCLVWVIILSQQSLLNANTLSSFSYALIVIAAVVFFKETINTKQVFGILLLSVGIYFVTH